MQAGQFASFTLSVAGATVEVVAGAVEATADDAVDGVPGDVVADADVVGFTVVTFAVGAGDAAGAEVAVGAAVEVRLTRGAKAALLAKAGGDDAASEARPGTVTTTVAPAGAATAGADGDATAEELLPAVDVATVHPGTASTSTAPTAVRARLVRHPRAAGNTIIFRSYTTGAGHPGRSRPCSRPSRTAGSPPAASALGSRAQPVASGPVAANAENEVLMTVHIRPALDALPAYAPGRTVPGAIKLASNEMSFPPLPAVTEAITDGAAGINRYPDNSSAALVAALAQLVGVDRSRVVAGSGSVALCQQLVQITCERGDEVLFGWRSFEAYPIVTQIVGAVPVRVPVTAGHALDLPAMAAAVTAATRLIYVCTPNNPTGTAVDRSELETFLDAVPDNVLVVIDEAYREFDTDPRSPDGVELATARPNVLALRTLSKAYQLAGLRVGYAVGDPAVIAALTKVAIPFSVNSLAQTAALAALRSQAELEPRWAQVISERVRVTEALRTAGYEVPESQANFVWLPLRERAAQFAAHAEDHKVIVRPFADASGGVRITIGSPEENDAFLSAATSFPL